jgi:glycosyltransferase involved in cell wall biosynthesis
MIDALFWASALAVAYTWVGYPALMAVVARVRRLGPRSLGCWPRMTVLIAAYNEARHIRAKLRSTLEQRYPRDRLDVVVVSDGSTDATDDIVARYPDPRVRLVRQEPRSGKSRALNRAVAAAAGDVLVFTDANALFAPEALARLAAAFHDPRVGLVSGQGLYGADGDDPHAVANGYVSFEAMARAGESALGFLGGADGAIYALRRSLYRELKPAEVNDLVHPIQTALAGYVCRFDPYAYTVEPPSKDAAQEFRRHTRIIAQGVELVVDWLPRLVRARRWRAVWVLLSHRVLRWATAALLAIALSTNVALAGRAPLYSFTLGLQLTFYAVAAAGWLAERSGVRFGPLALPQYFCVVAAAGAAGFVRYVRRGAEALWTPTGEITVKDRAA